MTPPNENYTLDLDSLIRISDLYNSFLKKTARKYNIYLCDLAEKIPPSTDFFYDDVHFNEKGSALVAKEIAKCINDENVM